MSNYQLLKDFFLTLAFKEEINLENPLGTKGYISIRFAELLDNLWNSSQPNFSPSQFKQCIVKLSSQFYG
jgi:ubiquitin carboxyl-terminal hydrolase 4/11/15